MSQVQAKAALFSNEQENLLLDVLCVAAGLKPGEYVADKDKAAIYELLEGTPLASFIVHVSDAMDELGLEVALKKQ